MTSFTGEEQQGNAAGSQETVTQITKLTARHVSRAMASIQAELLKNGSEATGRRWEE